MTDRPVTQSAWGYTVPGVRLQDAQAIGDVLQARLDVLNELALTVQHVRWNVIGPQRLSMRDALTGQVDVVRGMVDQIAERIVTLGLHPNGLPGALVSHREWSDYALHRGDAIEHVRALSLMATRAAAGHRSAAGEVLADPVTTLLLTQQTAGLEDFLGLLRAYFEDAAGRLTW